MKRQRGEMMERKCAFCTSRDFLTNWQCVCIAEKMQIPATSRMISSERQIICKTFDLHSGPSNRCLFPEPGP